MDLTESINREISPPEAAPLIGMGSWLLLKAKRNSTLSMPSGPRSDLATSITHRRFFMPSGIAVSVRVAANFSAACCLWVDISRAASSARLWAERTSCSSSVSTFLLSASASRRERRFSRIAASSASLSTECLRMSVRIRSIRFSTKSISSCDAVAVSEFRSVMVSAMSLSSIPTASRRSLILSSSENRFSISAQVSCSLRSCDSMLVCPSLMVSEASVRYARSSVWLDMVSSSVSSSCSSPAFGSSSSSCWSWNSMNSALSRSRTRALFVDLNLRMADFRSAYSPAYVSSRSPFPAIASIMRS